MLQAHLSTPIRIREIHIVIDLSYHFVLGILFSASFETGFAINVNITLLLMRCVKKVRSQKQGFN